MENRKTRCAGLTPKKQFWRKDWGGEGHEETSAPVTFARIEEHVYTVTGPTECSAQWMKQTQDSHEIGEH